MKLRLNRRWKYGYLLALLLCVLAGCGSGDWSSGDRVLVAKFLYDTGLDRPRRYDVVVFRFPRRPLENGTPKNYIKRLLGLPGELLAIFFGNLYRSTVPVEHDDSQVSPDNLWQPEGMHQNDARHEELWNAGKFEILRKPPETTLAMRRIVYDHDHPAKDLAALPGFERWRPADGSSWTADDNNGFAHTGQRQQMEWLRYRHVLRPVDWPQESDPDYAQRVEKIKEKAKQGKYEPQLITDFLGYNSFVTSLPDVDRQNWTRPEAYKPGKHNWVGDLILECTLKVEKAAGEFCMELSEGVDRFRACWQLDSGTCTLYRRTGNGDWTELSSKSTSLKGPGEYQLRFANVDDRLTVWVNRELPFGDGVAYKGPPPDERGPQKNDLEPASLGSKGAHVQVHHLKLWRDVYYTQAGASSDADTQGVDYSDPRTWDPLRKLPHRTIYVQPRHYFCLGDNSAQSSDGREWGLVPERLMLGRALMVYFPFNRAGSIE
jgi:signal peptidase I